MDCQLCCAPLAASYGLYENNILYNVGKEWYVSEDNLRKFFDAEEGGKSKKRRGKKNSKIHLNIRKRRYEGQYPEKRQFLLCSYPSKRW
jgi:hypothetical protein